MPKDTPRTPPDRTPDEDEPLGGARTGGVEEVAIPPDGIAPHEPASEVAPEVVVEEGRGRVAPGEAPFLEAQQEDDVEGARTCTRVVEHGHAARHGFDLMLFRRRRVFEAERHAG